MNEYKNFNEYKEEIKESNSKWDVGDTTSAIIFLPILLFIIIRWVIKINIYPSGWILILCLLFWILVYIGRR